MAQDPEKQKWHNYEDDEMRDRWNGIMLYHTFSYDNIAEYFNIFQHSDFEEFYSQYLQWHRYRRGYRIPIDTFHKELKLKVAKIYEELQCGRINNLTYN